MREGIKVIRVVMFDYHNTHTHIHTQFVGGEESHLMC